MSAERTLVTGFGPFGKIEENPSGVLAASLDRRHVVLPVSYGAVRAFLEELDPDSFDVLLMLGVRGRGRKIRVEQYARNQLQAIADVDGFKPDAVTISDKGPRVIQGSLWAGCDRPEGVGLSGNAGGYLCNFIYYEAARRFPNKRVGFVHVPPFERVPFDTQRQRLMELLDRIEVRH